MEWKHDTSSYLTFAENDYEWFSAQFEAGMRAPGMAALGQNICERYFKYLIDEYFEPETETENAQKLQALRSRQ